MGGAVLRPHHQRVVPGLGHRHGACHQAGVATLGEKPASLWLGTDLSQQRGEGHARPLGGGEHSAHALRGHFRLRVERLRMKRLDVAPNGAHQKQNGGIIWGNCTR